MPDRRNTGHRRHRAGEHFLPTYLVTLPVHTPEVRNCLARLVSRFGLADREWHEPHITLCGPLTLPRRCDPVTLLNDNQLLSRIPPYFDADLGGSLILRGRRGWAVVIRAEPCEALVQLASNIREALSPHLQACTWIDRMPGLRIFHISLSFGLRYARALSIRESLDGQAGSAHDLQGSCRFAGITSRSYRLAVIRRGVLWRVFNLPHGTWLTRGESFRCGKDAEIPGE